MNIIDIIIIVCLVASLIWGIKDGAIRQLGALVGIVVALLAARSFSGAAAQLLGIGGSYAHIWGYIIVLIVCMIAVAILVFMLRKLVSAVGLGLFDRIGGAIISALKCILILGLLASLFNLVNTNTQFIDKKHTEESLFFPIILSTSDYILPTINWVSDQIPQSSNDGE